MAMRMFRNGKEPVRMVSRSSLAWRGALATVFGFFSIFYGVMAITRAAQRPHAA